MDKFETAKERVTITEILSHFNIAINRSDFICCPNHNEKNPSCKVYKNNVKCFSCGFNGSVVDITMVMLNRDKYEAIDYLDNAFNLGLETVLTDEQKKEWANEQRKKEEQRLKEEIEKKRKEKLFLENIMLNQVEIVKYVEKCRQDVGLTNYWETRGFNNETIKRFNLGYDKVRKCVVIPYNRANNYYQSRSIEGKKYYKPNYNYAGSEPLYNSGALNLKDDCCFIVESPINAISIMQCGGNALAICGVANVNKLYKFLETNGTKCKKLIISFDNDNAGHEASIKLKKYLDSLKINNEILNLAESENDINDLLKKDPNILEINIYNILKKI